MSMPETSNDRQPFYVSIDSTTVCDIVHSLYQTILLLDTIEAAIMPLEPEVSLPLTATQYPPHVLKRRFGDIYCHLAFMASALGWAMGVPSQDCDA
jgi:hypothetical protein